MRNDNYIEYKYLVDTVGAVYLELIKMYPNGLRDTCNEACKLIKDRLEPKGYIVHIIHGEIRHSPWIARSHNWTVEHTWVSIASPKFKEKIYCDITISQFFDGGELNINPNEIRYNNIYFSTYKPKWFLPDGYNMKYRYRLISKLNKKFRFRYQKYPIGCIDFIQYILWGNISDFIRKYFLMKD